MRFPRSCYTERIHVDNLNYWVISQHFASSVYLWPNRQKSSNIGSFIIGHMAKPSEWKCAVDLYAHFDAQSIPNICYNVLSFKIYLSLSQSILNGARKVAHSPNQLPFVRNCVSPKACNFHPRPQLFPSIPPTRTRMVLVDTYFLRTDIEWLTFKRLAPNRCFSSF